MKKVTLVCCVLVTTFIASCSLFNSNSEDSPIIGNWELIRKTGGFIGLDLTPGSDGFNPIQVEFSSNHSYSFSLGDSVLIQGSYFLSKKDDMIYIKYLNNDENDPGHIFNKFAYFESDDTLILSDDCFDCFRSTYKRIK